MDLTTGATVLTAAAAVVAVVVVAKFVDFTVVVTAVEVAATVETAGATGVGLASVGNSMSLVLLSYLPKYKRFF